MKIKPLLLLMVLCHATVSSFGVGIAKHHIVVANTTVDDSLAPIDSILIKHIGMRFSRYHDGLMARYYALDNYGGIKTHNGAAISTIYDKELPVVLLDGVPILMIPYDVLAQVKFSGLIALNNNVVGKAGVYANAYEATRISLFTSSDNLNSKKAIKKNVDQFITDKQNDLPYYFGKSPIDSILLSEIGLTLTQYFNKVLADTYAAMYKKRNKYFGYSQDLYRGIMPTNISYDYTPYLELIDKNGENYSCEISIDGREILFFAKIDMYDYNRQINKPLSHTTTIGKDGGTAERAYIKKINIITRKE